MKRNVTTLVSVSLIFITMMILAGSCDGVLSDIIYYSAFVLPFAIGIYADGRQRRAESEHDREYKEPRSILTLGRDGTRLMLPLVFPTVTVVALTAYAVSLAITAVTGVENAVTVGDRLLPALLYHAALPCILEEVLFRYLPMRMLARYGARVTVIVSSVCFALVHVDVFRMPYALIAGILFMSVDLICESVWPSVIMHLLNNAASVLYIMYSGTEGFSVIYFSLLGALTAASLVPLIIMRKKYTARLCELFSLREPLEGMGALIALAAPSLLIAITSL